jgi:hypothetical protein
MLDHILHSFGFRTVYLLFGHNRKVCEESDDVCEWNYGQGKRASSVPGRPHGTSANYRELLLLHNGKVPRLATEYRAKL